MNYFIWNVDPVLISFGFLQIRWYGLMFLFGFIAAFLLMQWIYKREHQNPKELDSLLLYVMVGVVVGARLAHVIFYDPDYYFSNPIEILYVHKGGLASHGGALGAIVAIFIFSKRYKRPFLWLLSRAAIAGVATAIFVRIGNFFNSEILGLPTTLPWAVVFERVDNIPRHPVQIYEALSYLFVLLFLIIVYKRVSSSFATKIIPPLFLISLFGVRFLVEFAKTEQASYNNTLFFTTGQLLSLPYVVVGLIWLIFVLKNRK